MVSQVRVHDDIPRSWWQEQLRIDIVIPKQEDVVGNRDRLTDILEWLQSFANSNTHSPTRTVFWSFPSSSTNCRPNIHINEPLGTTLIQAVIFFYSFLSRWEVLWHSSVTHGPCAVCWALSVSRAMWDWHSKFWSVHILFMPSTARDWCRTHGPSTTTLPLHNLLPVSSLKNNDMLNACPMYIYDESVRSSHTDLIKIWPGSSEPLTPDVTVLREPDNLWTAD